MEADHFGDILGFEHLPSEPGTAIIEVPLRPRLRNRYGTVHGGVVMALMDAAGLWAGAPEDGAHPRSATVSVNCNFLRAARVEGDARLRASARVVKRGRSLYFSSIDITIGADGPLIASGQGVYSLPTRATHEK